MADSKDSNWVGLRFLGRMFVNGADTINGNFKAAEALGLGAGLILAGTG
jgi:hypothetical protein